MHRGRVCCVAVHPVHKAQVPHIFLYLHLCAVLVSKEADEVKTLPGTFASWPVPPATLMYMQHGDAEITTPISHRSALAKPTSDPILILSLNLTGLQDGKEFSKTVHTYLRMLFSSEREKVFFEDLDFDFTVDSSLADFQGRVCTHLLSVIAR